MKILSNFAEYTPENPEILGVRYLKSDTGLDWYTCQKSFKAETLKIVFNNSGVIASLNTDVSVLWPVGLSVAEITPTDIPEGVDINGRWIFDGQKIIQRTDTKQESVAQAKKIFNNLMTIASKTIAPLQDALDIGDATEEELTLLKAWKTYRVLLNRLDLSTAPNIIWPEIPA